MARVDLPESRLKARRRQRRRLVLLMFSGLLLVFLVGAVALTHFSAIRIAHIEVSGAETIASSTIATQVREGLRGAYAYVIPRDNIFFYPKQELDSELLAMHPTLASVDVHAVDFNTVAVVVAERSPRALWCSENNECYYMDENGVVYAPAPTFSTPIYTEYRGSASGDVLPKQFLNSADFQALSALVDAIAQKVSTATSSAEQLQNVVVDSNRDVVMQFSDNFAIKFALHDQAGDIFERFTLALTADVVRAHSLSDFEYIDLRFGQKLYYRLKNE